MRLWQRRLRWGGTALLVLVLAAVTLLLLTSSRWQLIEHLRWVGRDFEARVYRNARGETLNYRLLKPIAISPGVRYPLFLFFHGSFENGSDNALQLKNVVPAFDRPDIRRRYPCFVLAPQCPFRQNWVNNREYRAGRIKSFPPPRATRLTLELLDALERDYPIDPNRLYISGISSGGDAVWYLASRDPNRFAAAVPFAGRGDVTAAPRLLHLPIWAFHGGKDLVVNPQWSRAMIHAITSADGHPRYTEYPGVNHNCWYRAVKEPDFFSWLFAQRRHPGKSRPIPPPAPVT